MQYSEYKVRMLFINAKYYIPGNNERPIASLKGHGINNKIKAIDAKTK